MSLFGTTPSDDGQASSRRNGGLFDNGRASTHNLFDDDDQTHGSDDMHAARNGTSSPWDLPTPRRQQSRAELIRGLLPSSEVPDSYMKIFDTVAREDGIDGKVTGAGIGKLFAMAQLDADAQARIMSLVVPAGDSDVLLGRNEFNVLLALIGLAQEGDIISLDGVDERRRNVPRPRLPGLTTEPVLPLPEPDLSSVRMPATLPKPQPQPQTQTNTMQTQTRPQVQALRPAMDMSDDDPWSAPDLHKGHAHAQQAQQYQPHGRADVAQPPQQHQHQQYRERLPGHHRQYAPSAPPPGTAEAASRLPPNGYRHVSSNPIAGQNAWGAVYPEANNASHVAGPGFHESSLRQNPAPPMLNPFGGDGARRTPTIDHSATLTPSRSLGGRIGSGTGDENIIVTLMPGKEGIFMFQHHNYEVTSHRRSSKVIRRYSDFVWLLDCLHKRYPFRSLPLLPPKRVAVNGNHLSNDGAFIEKRRRGLSRFLNAIARHPVLSQEQLVVMFLTVPTELSVWRKQATISVQDEFADRALPEGLEESLPATLENLFLQTRNGVRRSAELYINACNIMDRLVKRTEGVAADHGRIAMTLTSLTESSADTYATDTNEVPLLNDGLVAMSKHLRTCQNLMEDEGRGWEEGVLEDLKRQRDALVSLRDMFERRERLDKDNIGYLEKRIGANEAKLGGMRARADEGGVVKAGDMERVAEAIIKDKESIVQQRNRAIFVRECIRDELITFQSSQYHVSRWNQDWAGERVKYAEMLADNWRRLLDELEGMPLGE